MTGGKREGIKKWKEHKALKMEIIKNQKFKCYVCGDDKYTHQFELAHIKDKKEYRNKEKSFYAQNLKALCRNCHGDFDDYKRYTKTPPKKWPEYKALLEKMRERKQGKKPTTKRPMKKSTRTTTKKSYTRKKPNKYSKKKATKKKTYTKKKLPRSLI